MPKGMGIAWRPARGRQIFCVFMMCTAACVFGLILGELQEIYASANMKARIHFKRIVYWYLI